MRNYELVLEDGSLMPRILPAHTESESITESGESRAIIKIGADIELNPDTPEFRVAARLATFVKAMESRFRNRWIPRKEGDELLSAKHRLALLGVPPHKLDLAFVPQDQLSADIVESLNDDDFRIEHAINLRKLNKALAPKVTPTSAVQERQQIVLFPTLRTE